MTKKTFLFCIAMSLHSWAYANKTPAAPKAAPAKQQSSGTCIDLNTCVNTIAAMTKKHYLFSVDLKGKVNASKNFNINDKNGDYYLTLLLFNHHFARVFLASQKDSYLIVPTREVHNYFLPVLTLNEKDEFNFMPNWDWAALHLQLKNPENGPFIVKKLQKILSRYGKIMQYKNGGIIRLVDVIAKMPEYVKLIKDMDRPLSKSLARTMK